MPASVMPMASVTQMQPAGIASIAVRVEIGDDQDSGVARSSRAGTKRSVKAGPTSRGKPGPQGLGRHASRRFAGPFLSRTVVMVPVETWDRVATASGDRDILECRLRRGIDKACAILRGAGHRVKGPAKNDRSHILSAQYRLYLLNLQADFA